jgi:hypothetical protein
MQTSEGTPKKSNFVGQEQGPHQETVPVHILGFICAVEEALYDNNKISLLLLKLLRSNPSQVSNA